MDGLRIVFMGTPEFAVPTLQALIDGPDRVVCVVTQPDRPAGRKRRPTPPPVKRLARAHQLPVLQPETLRGREPFQTLRAQAPDVAVVVAYGRILGRRYLELPEHGCLNLHASLLPRWRGAAPINWAVIGGERESGVCVMKMARGLDTGPVVRCWSTEIGETETAGELHDRLATEGARLMAEVLDELRRNGRLPETPQPDETPTPYARMLTKEDGHVDFEQPPGPFAAHVNGVTPWPGATCLTPRGHLRLCRARPLPGVSSGGLAPGTVVEVGADRIRLAVGDDGVVEILACQRPGRQALEAGDFLRGVKAELEGEVWRSPSA